jgi:hypothetical protein
MDASLRDSLRDSPHTLVDTVMVQIGTPDHEGWIRKKGGNFSTWRSRFLVLKGSLLYWLRSGNPLEAKVEGYVDIIGYRIVPDKNIDPGSYGFKLLRGSDSVHFFSSGDQTVVREWMKALLKPTIKRDHTKPMVIPTDLPVVSLEIAQAMHPRPPSPETLRTITIRRRNSSQMSMRSEATLTKMRSMSSFHGQNDKIPSRPQAGSSSTSGLETKCPVPLSTSAKLKAPVRPPRDARRENPHPEHPLAEQGLIRWANGHLPGTQIDRRGSNCSGLELLRIAESIKDIRSSCAPDSVFSWGPDHETLEGLFSLIDFLLCEDAKVGESSIDDVRRSNRDKIIQLLRALRAWERHRAILPSIGMSSSTPQGGPSCESANE